MLFLISAAGMGAATPGTCAACHRAETADFGSTGMARALENVKESRILRANPRMAAKIDGYSYELTRSGDDTLYTITDGKETIQVRLEWAFGDGAVGQTYLFQRDGRWCESRVSYYSVLRGLDITMGAQGITPHNLEEAAGRPMNGTDARDCFACHATGLVKASQLSIAEMIPGVQCERCHGPAEKHVSAIGAGDSKGASMRRLGELDTEQQSDFCGGCHRSWSQIAANGPRGVLNVRFQPYRLTKSKCYDAEDSRIRCTSCHNPHRSLETAARAYDSKCLACHSPRVTPTTKASAHICRVGKADCVTCHMPRWELPGAHRKFTDHMIRIARANESYPD